jgi:Homing endonuclease associated repeat
MSRRTAEQRLALAERITELRQRGACYVDIAAMLRISTSYAHQLFNAPSGEKERERKQRYLRPCERCGAWCNTSGQLRERYLCWRCAPGFYARMHGRKWPRELLVERIQEWNALHGSPPAQTDWNPYQATMQLYDLPRARRFLDADGHWPWFSVVVREFGSWSKAMQAAGFTPRRPGGYPENQQHRRNRIG